MRVQSHRGLLPDVTSAGPVMRMPRAAAQNRWASTRLDKDRRATMQQRLRCIL
ncbi:hypothetical protein Ga0080574_TMP3169 [Salipiger abyssi]|uniref:Uncharacterized protein n=1 Tax=Salipiger abyssi TaxID=1250539 RepID=A0A1P8UVU6_9RHOB|nr:hypothetical protein Ga0080574_TMP3169 [Salipiger abyssi]